MLRASACLLPFLALFAALPDPVAPDPNSPRPIAAVDKVFIEDLTWMEVRDALKEGKDTVLVPTGGVEQNGPYLVTGTVEETYGVHTITATAFEHLGQPRAGADAG